MALCCLSGMAQNFYDTDGELLFDSKEDTLDVISIKEVAQQRMQVSLNQDNAAHTKKVWGRRTFFDLTYYKSTEMKGVDLEKNPIWANKHDAENPLRADTLRNTKYTHDWGFGIKWGKNFRLHKKPIAKVATINLDYTWIDLGANMFSAEKNIQYDPAFKPFESTDNYGNKYSENYPAWEGKKMELSYGMALGPSLTLAPFTYVRRAENLHFLKFNVYYHVGYGLSGIFFLKDEDSSIDLSRNVGFFWGHGLSKAFGFTVNYKGIGIGIEKQSRSYRYAPMTDGFLEIEDHNDSKKAATYISQLDGKKNPKFDLSTTRIFLQFRL